MSASMVTCKCKTCQKEFEARVVDRKRGWARYCSKSCKAVKQEQRTGQHAEYQRAVNHMQDNPTFDNAHQFDNTEQ